MLPILMVSAAMALSSLPAGGAILLDPLLRIEVAEQPITQLAEWTLIVARHRQQIVDQNSCISRGCSSVWNTALATLRSANPGNLLRDVNRLVNRADYVPDSTAADRWSTPSELLQFGGDCEDFAIAKYFLLRELGVPAAAMRVVIMRATSALESHAVLVVHAGGEDFVLDNLRSSPRRYDASIAAATAYAFNGETLWVSLAY